jgi:hypothetical protein
MERSEVLPGTNSTVLEFWIDSGERFVLGEAVPWEAS